VRLLSGRFFLHFDGFVDILDNGFIVVLSCNGCFSGVCGWSLIFKLVAGVWDIIRNFLALGDLEVDRERR
jgi:hypothetical protein